MILGVGIDLLEIGRVHEELARRDWLLDDGIFTPREIRYCGGGKGQARRFAACFAAKEATLKALGSQVVDLAMFREVEVSHLPNGSCEIVLHDRLQAELERLGARRIRLSISHGAGQTVATVILEA